MFPLTVRGTVALRGTDADAVAVACEELLRELRMQDVVRSGRRITFGTGRELLHRALGMIDGGELVLEPGAPAVVGRYVLHFHKAAAFAALVTILFLVLILLSGGPTLGPALFIALIGFPWLSSGPAVTGMIAFEHWIVRAGADPTVPPRSIVGAHHKQTIDRDTTAVVVIVCTVLALALVAVLVAAVRQR